MSSSTTTISSSSPSGPVGQAPAKTKATARTKTTKPTKPKTARQTRTPRTPRTVSAASTRSATSTATTWRMIAFVLPPEPRRSGRLPTHKGALDDRLRAISRGAQRCPRAGRGISCTSRTCPPSAGMSIRSVSSVNPARMHPPEAVQRPRTRPGNSRRLPNQCAAYNGTHWKNRTRARQGRSGRGRHTLRNRNLDSGFLSGPCRPHVADVKLFDRYIMTYHDYAKDMWFL